MVLVLWRCHFIEYLQTFILYFATDWNMIYSNTYHRSDGKIVTSNLWMQWKCYEHKIVEIYRVLCSVPLHLSMNDVSSTTSTHLDWYLSTEHKVSFLSWNTLTLLVFCFWGSNSVDEWTSSLYRSNWWWSFYNTLRSTIISTTSPRTYPPSLTLVLSFVNSRLRQLPFSLQ
jgi:hypothetical protein